ncbi:MAG: protein arginine kinase [Clostridia bacterium]|nr:protein arginine kinase [Clostridia bacterium]
MIWYKNNDSDIVISTRIRLARNVNGIPFPQFLKDKSQLSGEIKDSILKSNSTLAADFSYIELDQVSHSQKLSMAEEHLISPQMLDGNGKSVLINKDKTMSIMLMEEDHIRLQIIKSGLALDEAYETANRVDDVIEESLTYAFDENFGYLTACPTNAGTGLRASVMMHLPALTMTKNMNRVINASTGLGIEIRGLYGEGTSAEGNLYQISNRLTLGLSEAEILEKLKGVVKQIVESEQKARALLLENSKAPLEDRLFRSYGILKYARSISSSEAKERLSDVMLGINMGILLNEGKLSALECMVKTAPSFISEGKDVSPEERDIKRAEFIRNNI